jgi:hypothetical protein
VLTQVGPARPDPPGGPSHEPPPDHRAGRRAPQDGRAVQPLARYPSDIAADKSTGYSPTRTAASCPSRGRGRTAHAAMRDGSATPRLRELVRKQDPARSDSREDDHDAVASLGSAGRPVVREQVSTQHGETALPETEAGIVDTSRAFSTSTNRWGSAVPGVVAIEDRADFLAGWAAGQATAAACGPLPDEIARDVVLLLETSTPTTVSPRRPRGGVKDVG